MRSFVYIVFLMFIRHLNGGCPKATFEFFNNTMIVPYNFIDSSVGNIGSLETCPYTGRPYVYLPCYPNSSWGNEPYFSTCMKPPDQTTTTITKTTTISSHLQLSIEEISKLPLNNSKEISNVISYLNQENLSFSTSSDLISAIDILDRLTVNPYLSNTDTSIYSIINKIFSSKSLSQAQKTNQSLTKLLSSLDIYSQNYQTNEFDQHFHQSNFLLSIVNKPNNRTKPILGFAFNSITNQTSSIDSNDPLENSTCITLDSRVVAQQNRLIFSVINSDTNLFDDDNQQVLTRIISLTIDKPNYISHYQSFVNINFFLDKDLSEDNQTNLTCAYWKIFSNRTAQWSTDGCQLIERTNRNVLCQCNHLTHFAILMDVTQEPIPKVLEQTLTIISLSGLVLSSIGLSLTILTFILFKKLRRHFSQKSLLLLSINLLFVNLLFSIIDFYRSKNLFCTIIAGLLHYFVLSSFSWMFVMAWIQYLLFVKVFPPTISAFTTKAAAFAQIVPLIPITVILIFDPWIYTKRNDQICWLSNYPLYLSFILPIALYILINSILFSLVAHALLCGKTGQQLRSTQVMESQRLSRFLVALSCFVVLGLTWSFGLFSIGPMRFLFQILFCIFATLTGFFIFILYIVTSKAKRTCWTNTFKNLGISSISNSSALIGTKEFSTTSTNDQQQQQKIPSRLVQFPSQPQHFIDAYMPTAPPPPAPPFLIEGDDPLNATTLGNQFYESRHIWMSQTNLPPTTSLDDYSLFYAANHDTTKL